MTTYALLRQVIPGAIALGCLTFSSSAQDTFDLPESWAYASDSKGEAGGFTGRVVQARKNAGLTATVARGNAHLSGKPH